MPRDGAGTCDSRWRQRPYITLVSPAIELSRLQAGPADLASPFDNIQLATLVEWAVPTQGFSIMDED